MAAIMSAVACPAGFWPITTKRLCSGNSKRGVTANRVADIFVGAQFVLYHGEGAKPTVAASYFHRAYDGGAPEFDYGSPTNSVLILASADVEGISL